MSRGRHIFLAYLILLGLLFLILKLALQPAYNDWQSAVQHTISMQAELRSSQDQFAQLKRNKAKNISEIAYLINSDSISFASNATDAGHRLQQRIKQLLKPHSAVISQLRPNSEILASGLAKSELELNIRMPNESLQPLLDSLAEGVPRLHIELLSIRNSARYSTDSRTADLDIRVKLVMWYVERGTSIAKLLIENNYFDAEGFSLAEGSLLAEGSSPAEGSLLAEGSISAEGSSPRSHEQNTLVGLFDLNARKRLSSPSIDHYRVAAINISNNARIAVVTINDTEKSLRLKQGDLLDVWHVESIDTDGVSLRYKDQLQSLSVSK